MRRAEPAASGALNVNLPISKQHAPQHARTVAEQVNLLAVPIEQPKGLRPAPTKLRKDQPRSSNGPTSLVPPGGGGGGLAGNPPPASVQVREEKAACRARATRVDKRSPRLLSVADSRRDAIRRDGILVHGEHNGGGPPFAPRPQESKSFSPECFPLPRRKARNRRRVSGSGFNTDGEKRSGPGSSMGTKVRKPATSSP